ncbi:MULTISPECIES: alpha/beta fold hydrolase [Actinosynnema]|uniref:alpha/beta fold hydrolase n=1 Tax=Actinosynnema TaxID=40566 RepID=UPI0020A5708B|nr:alpha/beta fold hydrolase [Actinosynnema pretiosum]MCP2094254.1 Pimeloyl-ACP methyl ester carboxylesterase [Actinosynnema pretiosum]
MPTEQLNGTTVRYDVTGEGELAVLVMGTGASGKVWHAHQVPALVAAGFRVATPDNRGVFPADARGFTVDDLVGDVAALVERLGGPARVVGTSLGARVAQELALARPDLVRSLVLLATAGRADPLQLALARGERELFDRGVNPPPAHRAAVSALSNLSPATLRDPAVARDWLDLLEFTEQGVDAGVRAQLELAEFEPRLAAYRGITAPTLVVGFADDRLVPPHLCREVADAIPGARYAEVADAGHYGYLERPDEVNRLVVEFLRG